CQCLWVKKKNVLLLGILISLKLTISTIKNILQFMFYIRMLCKYISLENSRQSGGEKLPSPLAAFYVTLSLCAGVWVLLLKTVLH
ncbi:hypothetical protein, partial [Klebsiella pneumoniae]|uniref:hypothetical protein n=1 Tax=Klebsiella pneumoniae TaxID=573 RepID=UPI0040557FDE